MRSRWTAIAGALGAVVAVAGCTAPSNDDTSTAASPSATANTAAMTSTLDFIKDGIPKATGTRIAYLAECVTENSYCQTRLQGAQAAADAAGAELVVFNAGFDTSKQLQQVQDSVQSGYDAYVFSPVADAPGCSDFALLKATGKPVATINSPMCGNQDYTPGTAGFVAMQTESYFLDHLRNAFASCTDNCKAVAVGGYLGTDLYERWESALEQAKKEYPKVDVVSAQPGDFDPSTALKVVQDALTTNPDISVVVSSWDDMTRGAAEAVTAAGKTPGTDVRIYSIGGTKAAATEIAAGRWTESSALLPYEESYYGVIQAVRAQTTGEQTPGFTSLAQAPAITDGPGTVLLTKDNIDRFQPRY